MDRAALVERILGLGFSTFGRGGGRAATWGAAASGKSDVVDETGAGGVSVRVGCGWLSGLDLTADIIARLTGADDVEQHG